MEAAGLPGGVNKRGGLVYPWNRSQGGQPGKLPIDYGRLLLFRVFRHPGAVAGPFGREKLTGEVVLGSNFELFHPLPLIGVRTALLIPNLLQLPSEGKRKSTLFRPVLGILS